MAGSSFFRIHSAHPFSIPINTFSSFLGLMEHFSKKCFLSASNSTSCRFRCLSNPTYILQFRMAFVTLPPHGGTPWLCPPPDRLERNYGSTGFKERLHPHQKTRDCYEREVMWNHWGSIQLEKTFAKKTTICLQSSWNPYEASKQPDLMFALKKSLQSSFESRKPQL